MKLLLSDGTAVAVSSYEKTSTAVNGNTVDAISITTEKTTLEKVKKLFADSDNLAVIHMYSNENILIDTFNGYQIRKSIALGENDTSFIVLLAKSSEVNEQLAQFSLDMTNMRETISTMNSSINTLKKKMEDLILVQEDDGKKFSAQVNTIKELTDAVNTMKESDSDRNDTIKNLEIDFEKIVESFNSFADTANQIAASYNSMTESINATNENSANALKNVDVAVNRMISYSDSIEYLQNLMNEVKELATDNDQKVINYGNTSSILTENVNNAKLSVEKFEEKLSETNGNVREVLGKIDDADKSIRSINDNMIIIEENVNSLEEEHTKSLNDIDALASRVSNIEPVTDYTTLSLEDAKKFRIEESKVALATYLDEHPITSTCHGGVSGQYSITSEKQSFLQAMISITMLAEENGVEYQPSWNKVGESCTYDWTLAELQQLAIEIEATVRPLVSHQQAIEKEIIGVKNMNALQAVYISYDVIQPNNIVIKKTTEETDKTAQGTSTEGTK